MKYTVFVGLLIVFLTSETRTAELPSNWKTCSRSSSDFSKCVSKASAEAIMSLAQGLKSFKILPVDPLAVESVSIGETGGPVSLKQNYKNVKLHGLTKGIKISDYDLDFDKLVLRSNSFNPQVDFVADYTLDGKILLLPIRGHGHANITMLDMTSKSTVYCEKYEKNGQTYLRVKKYDIKFAPTKVLLSFDNLFDGDKVLGDQMNKFLNENSELIFKEVQAPYEETFALVFAKLANDIFSRVPMDKIFPK